MKKSKELALGGIITALCSVLNFLASVVPGTDYIFPAVSGAIITIIAFKSGYKLGFMVYISAAILSFLICVDKFPAFLFLLFFGFYPMAKFKIDSWKLKYKFTKFLIKAFIFNSTMILNFWFNVKIFNIPESSFYIFDVYLPPFLLAIGNFSFIMYENLLNKFKKVYLLYSK